MASCSPLRQRTSGSTPAEADVLPAPRRPPDPRHQIHKIQRALDAKLSKDTKTKIQSILDKVSVLNDVEKFLLYLQLPTGISSPSSPFSGQLAAKTEQTYAETWISSHLEEDSETCMPKSEIYEEYKMFCERHKNKWLNIGDFNRLLKTIFPRVKARRLGNRGQSRYCFSGIRARVQMTAPSLPIIDATLFEADEDESDESLEVTPASSDVICQWATKLFSQPFASSAHLAKYLIANNYVSPSTLNAFTVLADPSDGEKPAEPQDESSSSSPDACPRLDKHKSLQMKLQRKLQERATLNEQKKRMEEQRQTSTGKKVERVEEKEMNPKATEEEEAVEEEAKPAPPAPPPPPPPPPLQKRILPKIGPASFALNHFVSTPPVNPVLLLSPTANPPATTSAPLVIMNSPSSVIHLQQKPPLAPPMIIGSLSPDLTSPSSSLGDVSSPVTKEEPLDEEGKESTISCSDLASVIPGISQSTLASLTKKSKSTPVKPRVSGKTISDLLKTQRRANGQPDKKYANDRRPVAQLLRESRQQKSPQTSSQPFVIQPLSLNNNNNNTAVQPPSSSTSTSSSSTSTIDSQLKQMVSQQSNNPKLRDLLTGRDDLKVPLLQTALKTPNAMPSKASSNGIRGSQRDMRRLHPDLKASSVSFAGIDFESALNQEVQELCSRANTSSGAMKRAASEPPAQSCLKKQATETMLLQADPDESWNNSFNDLGAQGVNDLGVVPSDLADMMPSIPQMLEADHSLNTLRQAASLINSNIEPLLLADSMEQLMLRQFPQQSSDQEAVHASMLNAEPSPSPSYSSTTSTPLMSPNNAASFMPISSSSAQCVDPLMSPVRPTLTAVAPKLEPGNDDALLEFNQALFAPASSIKPVKRGKGRGKSRTTRQRHHSAQDSLLLRSSMLQQQMQPLVEPPPPPPPPLPLPPPLPPQAAGPVEASGGALNVCVNQQQPMDVPSPFSPEIQDIMYSNGSMPWFEQNNSFRSHSVPVHLMAQGGNEPVDTSADFSQQIALLQQKQQIALLQQKLQNLRQTNDTCRNITQMIESSEQNSQLQTQPQGLSCVGRGDHLISGAPFRPPLRYALNAELKAREMYAMQGNVRRTVPTPPSSQNPTPDFSPELSGVHYEVTPSASSSVLDTTNSLEPMVDLSNVCEEQHTQQGRTSEGFVWD